MSKPENISQLIEYKKTVRRKCLPWAAISIIIFLVILPLIPVLNNSSRNTKIIICLLWIACGLIASGFTIVQNLKVKKEFGLVCPNCKNYLSCECLDMKDRNINCRICGNEIQTGQSKLC